MSSSTCSANGVPTGLALAAIVSACGDDVDTSFEVSLFFIFVDFMDAGHEMTASSDEVRVECDPSHLGVSSMPATSECGPRDGNPPAGKPTTENSIDDNVSTMAG